ncbi:MAG: pyridoxal-phosphate dependent enzyme [Balneolaceae bacterium]|nr:pyridoxal-phosphate dependent enzyme [Balneolaceae bacterium]
MVEQTGAAFIHPYNDPRIIAGQGTSALEMVEDAPPLDLILAPVGGGGLISGTAVTAAGMAPSARVVGCEPERADDAFRSFRDGRLQPVENPDTIADGLRTSLGELPFACMQRHLHDMVTVSEEEIREAMRYVWERMKIIIEPSSAVPVAALLGGHVEAEGATVGIIISGGNVDLDHLPW